MGNKPGISFIVCCYNSAVVIQATIAALANQKNQGINYEVLLIDNNCTDETVRIAQSTWSRKDVQLSIVQEDKLGLSYARMKGVKHAQFSIISFVDDDNIVEEQWIVKVFSLFQRDSHIGITGSNNKALLETAPDWFVRFQSSYACGEQHSVSGYLPSYRKYVFGAGLSIRSKIIKDIYSLSLPLFLSDRKGEQLLAGGDSEICMRAILMGYKIWYEKDLILLHKILPQRLTWAYLCKLYEGFGYSSIILRMFSTMIDDDKPIMRGNAARSLIKQFWIHYLQSAKNVFFATSEIKKDQLNYHFLKGRFMALKDMFNDYNQIASDIYKYYIKLKSSRSFDALEAHS